MEKMRLDGTKKNNQVKPCNKKNKEINPNSPYLKIWIQFVVFQNSDFDLLSSTSPESELELKAGFCLLVL